jgi:hypothetical protein
MSPLVIISVPNSCKPCFTELTLVRFDAGMHPNMDLRIAIRDWDNTYLEIAAFVELPKALFVCWGVYPVADVFLTAVIFHHIFRC